MTPQNFYAPSTWGRIDVIVIDGLKKTYKVVNVQNNMVEIGKLIGAKILFRIGFGDIDLFYNEKDVEFKNIEGQKRFFYNKEHPFLLCNTDGNKNLISITDNH